MAIEIRLAKVGDIQGLMTLESRYFIGNLGPGERGDGFMSVEHPEGWFAEAISLGGIHVAVADGGEIVGFMAVTPPPAVDKPGLPAVVREMVRLAESVALGGKALAKQAYCLHGPVCIDERFRGQGIFSAFEVVTRKAYWGRYQYAVLFVSVDNPRSLHTVTTKLGARDLVVFTAEGKSYHLLAFEF